MYIICTCVKVTFRKTAANPKGLTRAVYMTEEKDNIQVIIQSTIFHVLGVRRMMHMCTPTQLSLLFVTAVLYQRVGRLYMQGWRRRAMYAILKQTPYTFTTKTLKAYLSASSSSLSAFMISKTHIYRCRKATRKKLNAKVCSSKSAVFVILSSLFNNHN